jgi:hypothetical protein
MTAATQARERALAHVVRSRYGPRRFGDGMAEPGTPEYEALAPGEQLRICEQRAGIFREPPEGAGVAPSVRPRPYVVDDPIRSPLDEWEESEWL